MPAVPTIRCACDADLDALAALSAALGYPADAGAVRERLAAVARSDTDLLVVAESGGTVIGWMQAHSAWILETGLRVEITGLVVAAGARRCGAGRALVAGAESWARSLGARTLVVRTDVRRPDSPLFYPAVGFARRKTQDVYSKPLA